MRLFPEKRPATTEELVDLVAQICLLTLCGLVLLCVVVVLVRVVM